jgi:peptide/nickel transport system substrate-binding protein
MHGTPALPADFARFAYANPAAPKGGRLVQGLQGSFDSLNPFVVRGIAVQAIRGFVVESLMQRGQDEPFSLYGHLAASVETDDARTFVVFRLDPEARFSDGRPVTADDVIFSWSLLRDRGRPNHRTFYRKVENAEAVDALTVRFSFSRANDRELPLILGLMPVLARHATDPETFERTGFTAPVGSGAYRVDAVEPGSGVTLKRRADYWAADRPTQRGLWNFDEVRLDWYGDGTTLFEAFRKGLVDLRVETDPGRWTSGYDFPAAREGRVLRENIATGLPKGMSGLVFNTRRPVFADSRVREAIGHLFDFEWVNRSLYGGQFRRTASWFEGSALSARRRPADDAERALLARFPDAVRADILDGTWDAPVSDGTGTDRGNLTRALTLFEEAGWVLARGRLVEKSGGRPFRFEHLVVNREQERLAIPFRRDLARAGIEVSIRPVDSAQYERRRQTWDFDMIQFQWNQSLSPGNEQSFYYGSAAADQPGSRNYMGVKSTAIDAMIAALLAARDREPFESAVRALDRVLMSGFHVVPLFHPPAQWVARWSHIRRPDQTPTSGFMPETFWSQP